MCVSAHPMRWTYLPFNFVMQMWMLVKPLFVVHILQQLSHASTMSQPKVSGSDETTVVSFVNVPSIRKVVPPTIWFMAFSSSSNLFARSKFLFSFFSLFFISLEFKVRVFNNYYFPYALCLAPYGTSVCFHSLTGKVKGSVRPRSVCIVGRCVRHRVPVISLQTAALDCRDKG